MRLLEIIWWSGVGAIISGAVVSAIAVRKYYKLFEFAVSRTQQMRKYRDELMLLKQTEIRVLEPKPLITPAEDDPEFVEALAEAERQLLEEEERAEYALGVHLEQKRIKRMGESCEPF